MRVNNDLIIHYASGKTVDRFGYVLVKYCPCPEWPSVTLVPYLLYVCVHQLSM